MADPGVGAIVPLLHQMPSAVELEQRVDVAFLASGREVPGGASVWRRWRGAVGAGARLIGLVDSDPEIRPALIAVGRRIARERGAAEGRELRAPRVLEVPLKAGAPGWKLAPGSRGAFIGPSALGAGVDVMHHQLRDGAVQQHPEEPPEAMPPCWSSQRSQRHCR